MTLARILRRTLLLGCAVLTIHLASMADEPAVPLQLQVDLTVKVMEYVQQPPIRSGDVVRLAIVVKSSNAQSTHFGAELKAALDRVDTIAGLPHEQILLEWIGPSQLVDEIARSKLAIVYVAPGLDSEIPVIAQAVQGIQLVTVAAVDSYVRGGLILGFELVSGRPKMVFNLTQARQQSVVFGSAVMKLMRIVE
jgi:hypothetical protein